MGRKIKNCDALTGGASRALDSYAVATLSDKDRAIVLDSSNNLTLFEFQGAATDAEDVANHPYRVRPDDYSSAGVWYEQEPLYIRKDGTLALTGDWDIGDGRKIEADKIAARDGDGLYLVDDGDNGIFVEDGGQVGIGTAIPTDKLQVENGNIRIKSNTYGTLKVFSSQPGVILVESDGNADENWWIDVNLGVLRFMTVSDALDAWPETALLLEQDGTISLGDGNKLRADKIQARDADGLYLVDDGDNGIFVEDGGNVGVGATPDKTHLDVYNNAVDTADNYTGIRSYHTKTAGATGLLDSMVGIVNSVTFDQSGDSIGEVRGVDSYLELANGTIGITEVGVKTQAHVKAGGTLSGDLIGVYSIASSEGGSTISGDVQGLLIYMNIQNSPSGIIYDIYLDENEPTDYGIYQNGSALNYFGGKLDSNADTIRVRTSKTPASAGAAGNAGDICWDSGYVYVCVATNTWKRAALSAW